MASRLLINNFFHTLRTNKTPVFHSNLVFTAVRHSSYRSSKPVGPSDLYTNVEISKSLQEWAFVERLLPSEFAPEPTPKSEYPSGWRPPAADASSRYPYFVERNRNHMYPVYLQIKNRGQKRTTMLKHIHGDIWALEKELKRYLTNRAGKKVLLQVIEPFARINIKGDHVSLVQEWLQDKEF